MAPIYPLPVNIDSTYADSGTDPSVQIHQAHHDQIHAKENDVPNLLRDFSGVDPTGATGSCAGIQNWLNSLPVGGASNQVSGGIADCPPGRYQIDSPGLVLSAATAFYLRGTNYASTGHSAQKVLTQFFTPAGATWPAITIGVTSGSALWYSPIIENISFADRGGTGTFNTTGAIQVWNPCMGQIINCDFQNFQAGTGVLFGELANANPQYWKVVRCRSELCKTALYAHGADLEVLNCDFHGVRAGQDTIIAGSIGIDASGGVHVFGGSMQDWETAIALRGVGAHIVGTAFENASSGTGGLIAIDLFGTAARCHVSGVDIVGPYATAGVRLQAGASRNAIFDAGSNLTGFSGNGSLILNQSGNGTNVIYDPKFGTGFPWTTTAGRPSATTVGKGQGFLDDTLHKVIISDGTNWRDTMGNLV